MKTLFVFFIVLPVVFLLGAVLLNRPPLFDEPGVWQRLRVYLGTNVAETLPDHPFPEMRTPVFQTSAQEMRARIMQAIAGLGWLVVPDEGEVIHTLVATPLFGFRDDVFIQIIRDGEFVRLKLRSVSRVGKADFAANQRHIRELLSAL